MFCSKCGKEIADTAKFCPFCGAANEPLEMPAAPQPPAEPLESPVEEVIKAAVLAGFEKEPIPEQAEQPVQNCANGDGFVASVESAEKVTDSEVVAPPAKKKFPVLAVIIPAAVVALGIIVVLVWTLIGGGSSKLLKEGAAYLAGEDYRAAEEAFRKALDKKPGNADAAMGLAEALIFQGDCDEAREVLEDAKIRESNPSYDEYRLLYAASGISDETCEIITENFPNVTVNFDCGKAEGLEVSATVEEDDEERPVTTCAVVGDKLSVTFESADSGYEPEYRDTMVFVQFGRFIIPCNIEYYTPEFTPANVRLVSTDISAYPTVKAYFRVEDPLSGETVADLGPKSFIIREKVEGGEYVSREVHSVEVLEGNQGLNIDLVADKSDSISYSDMEKIKEVMTEFVNDLDYAIGDKAEILAFDDIVQQMCYYTNDSNLLINGINNMSTDGMTAFYDAVYTGVHNAALQGGARCVIAFTDGMDNMSDHDEWDVIDYANERQVPVYIIGVGYSVEEYTLRNIAESTGGRYWFIDDLYDLEEIFATIYSEQMELYVVEYTSDAAVDGTCRRDVEVVVSGGGFKGETSETFEPVLSIGTDGASTRYELIKEACTWEEAAARCQAMGGHLATVTSQDEEELLIAMAEAEGVNYVWLGGYTSYDDAGNVFAHWITGEDFIYADWCIDEPSRVDKDGTPEWYLMLWNIESLGGWNWNDQRNDPAAVVSSMTDEMGYICEFEI